MTFRPALKILAASKDKIFGPENFQTYLTLNALPPANTAAKISVQTLGDLDPDLRHENVMGFRLGASGGKKGTNFGLVQARDGIDEFFLIDESISDDSTAGVATFVPDVSDLYPFQLLETVTETGAVNLAIASGLLGYALGCEPPYPRIAPATGASTFTFDVRPHDRLQKLCWDHCRGQVEIDAVFFGRRKNQRTLFVIEAKHGAPSRNTSLAKTKLAYSCSAIATKRVPADIPIVPVYLRSWHTARDRKVRFSVKECCQWNPTKSFTSDINVETDKLFEMAFG